MSREKCFSHGLVILGSRSTLESLFKFGLRDFKGLAIEKLWKDGTYHVVRLDFARITNFTTAEEFQEKFYTLLWVSFQQIGFQMPVDRLLTIVFLAAFLDNLPDGSLVVLIDDYDAPLTACQGDNTLFEAVRSALVDFFLALKSCDNCLRFVFVTSSATFSSTGIFSDANKITDISLHPLYDTLLGFTEKEIKEVFGDYLVKAEKALGVTEDALLKALRTHEDGFCFDVEARTSVYCPESVLRFLHDPTFRFANCGR